MAPPTRRPLSPKKPTPAATTKPPAARSRQPAARSRQAAARSRQPAAPAKPPAAAAKHPAATTKPPGAAKKPPAAAKKPPAAAKKQPAATSARGTRRAVAKVSPLAGMDVGEWLDGHLAGWQAELGRRLLALVADALPDATIAIKWGQPVVDVAGPVAWMRGARAHLGFGFWRGAELDDRRGVLEGEGDRMRHLKLRSAEDLDEADLRRLLVEAAALNRRHGSPARR